MKKLTKFICLLLAMTLSCSLFAACGGGSSNKGDSLNVYIHEAGFGYDWLEEIGLSFKAQTGVDVKVRPIQQDAELPKIQAGRSDADIAFLLSDMTSNSELGLFVELDELVYNKTPYGQEGALIKDLAPYYDVLNVCERGKHFAISYASSIQGLLYNKTTLDTIYPDGYTLPLTTDQWIAQLTDIKTNHTGNTTDGHADNLDETKAYGLVSAADYMEYIGTTWWAQYDGANKFFDYWAGCVDGQFNSSAPAMAQTDGRLESLKAMESIYSKSTGFVHQNNAVFYTTEGFKSGQEVFAGKGYNGIDMRMVAYYPCGNWYENEMGSLLDDQEVRMMKVPVISSIVNTFADETDKQMSDETLASIIAKIDAGTPYSSEYGCAEATYNKVKEARNIVSSQGELHQALILKSSQQQQNAADFLRYVISDAGQAIYSKYMKGLDMGYGYVASEDPDVTVSAFAQSTLDMVNNDTIFVYRDISKAMCTKGDLAAFTTNNNRYSVDIYNGKKDTYATSAEYVYNATYTKLSNNWAQMIRDAGLN